jgi:MFS family permease
VTVSLASSSNASFRWWHDAPASAKRALLAAGLGWMLDSFDVMLYSLVLASLMTDLGIDKPTAGLLGSVTLVASAAGGLLFGVIADRFGRTKALMGSILTYSVFTAACGLSQNAAQLAVFRICLGIGMGGEWASGASLVSESWPREHRGKALGLMQSAWAIGYGAAAIVTWLVLPRYGWRAVFFVGVIPALLTMWIRRYVEEPAIWKTRPRTGQSGFRQLFAPGMAGLTVALTIMNACTLFAWWGFNLWLPGFLALPVAQGGVGLSTATMSGFVVAMQIGMWFGYVTFGFVSDALGRKRVYITYLIVAAVLLFIYVSVRTPIVLLLLGPLVAFFATGYYSGFGAVTAEVYPTAIRATAQGFTYNVGRVASAVAPYAVGSLAQTRGFSAALSICSVAFLLAALTWIWIPETHGRELV